MEKEELKQKIRSLISEFFKLFVVTTIAITICILKFIYPDRCDNSMTALLIIVTFLSSFACGNIYFMILKYLKIWKRDYGNHITIKELLNHENQ
jgi:hypothetical protein